MEDGVGIPAIVKRHEELLGAGGFAEDGLERADLRIADLRGIVPEEVAVILSDREGVDLVAIGGA